MAIYFHVSRNVKDLKLALSAFEKADPESTNPDLFHSRGIIYSYFEQYEKAVRDLQRATMLDPELGCGSIVTSIKAFVVGLETSLESKVLNG